MSLTIEPLNLPEVERQMAAWGRSLRLKVLERVIEDELELVLEDVQSRLDPHVRTGVMQEGVEIIRKGPGAVAINLADQYHGQMLEWGSSNEPADPILRPSLDENKDELVMNIGDHLRGLLRAAR